MKLPVCTVGYLLLDLAGRKTVFLGKKARTEKAVKRKIAGKWLGYGGDVEESDASIAASFARELRAESNYMVEPKDLVIAARVLIKDERGDRLTLYYLLAPQWRGEAKTYREFDEYSWFPQDALPDVLGADKLVLPRIFQGEKLVGFVEYDADMNVVSHRLDPIETVPVD